VYARLEDLTGGGYNNNKIQYSENDVSVKDMSRSVC